MKTFWNIFGWIVIRPIRKIMWWATKGSFGLRLWPKKEWGEWKLPNLHYWVLYKTLGNFSTWLYWDAWRVFCDWTGGFRRTYPWPAKLVHSIGKTLAWCFYGGSCYHCGSFENDPSSLSEDETGTSFKLTDSGTSQTYDGTDHWFRGITTCQKCGYQQEYGDSSL